MVIKQEHTHVADLGALRALAVDRRCGDEFSQRSAGDTPLKRSWLGLGPGRAHAAQKFADSRALPCSY